MKLCKHCGLELHVGPWGFYVVINDIGFYGCGSRSGDDNAHEDNA